MAGEDGQVQGVAQRVRRSSSEFRKLCDGFGAGGKMGNAAVDKRTEHSVNKLTFASIFEKLSDKNAKGTSPRPKCAPKTKKLQPK